MAIVRYCGQCSRPYIFDRVVPWHNMACLSCGSNELQRVPPERVTEKVRLSKSDIRFIRSIRCYWEPDDMTVLDIEAEGTGR